MTCPWQRAGGERAEDTLLLEGAALATEGAKPQLSVEIPSVV